MSKTGAMALAFSFIVMFGVANAGNLDSPGIPSSGSSMYSLSDIYEYLITGLEPVVSNSFQEPSSGSGSTGKTTKEIYDDLKALFDQAAVMPGEVLNTVIFFSTYSDAWGPTQGMMPNVGRKDFIPGTSDQTIDQGYHNGGGKVIGDADLVAGNIASGVDIFGVAGTADVASGDAATGDVLSGKTFSNDSGAGLTGAMTNVGAQNITPNTSEQNIHQGYHDGAGKVAGDADLTASNIKDGIEIFGVTGTVKAASGNAEAGDVLSGKTFSNDAGSSTGTMTDNGAATITPGASNQTIAQGYHNGSGAVDGDSDLTSGNIKAGVDIFGVTGSSGVVDTSDGDAAAGDLRSGKKAYVDGALVTGNIPDGSDVTGADGSLSFNIPNGYYSGKTSTAQDSHLAAGNIKEGVNIFGVDGTVKQASGNATNGQVLTGATYSNDSGSFTGTMADNSAATITPGTSNQTIAQGYHNGSGTVYGDEDLVEGKILSGVTIFNVTGNVIRATGAAADSQVLAGVTYSSSTGGSTGTMPDKEGDNASTARSASGGVNYFTAPAGYYDGDDRVSATDAQVAALASSSLISDNLKYGVTIFGVSGGNKNVVNTSSGDANAENIAAGKKAWVDGAQVTGTSSSIPAYPFLVPETGQTAQYDENPSQGDDGGVDPPGISIPTPRFSDNGDGTVTDNLTGLIWMKNAYCANTRTLWQVALDYVVELNTAGTMNGNNCGDTGGHSDWRVPTIKELFSLVNFNYQNLALSNAAGTGQWSEGDAFTGVKTDYWSSTTNCSGDTKAWMLYTNSGTATTFEKNTSPGHCVWPVRGGQ